ncbi:MAG: hypothetical protein AB1Z98_00060, partial [Nannocystaceae bacterium]
MRLIRSIPIPLTVLTLTLAPVRAEAVSIFASDCSFGFQDVYNAGDAVCVTGDLDVVPPGGICGEAYVFVVASGGANPFFDVSAGGPNYILGCAGAGAFFDEYVWLPPLIPGQYDLVIDQWPFGGGFGGEDLWQMNAFSVSNAPIVFSVDVGAIKGAAVEGLAYALSLQQLTKLLALIDTLSTAADWAGTFGAGGALAAILLAEVCAAADVDCPTSYNSAVIAIGNRIIGHMGEALELHYLGIIADPPDPNFEDVVALQYEDAIANGAPWAPQAGAPLPAGQVLLGQSLATQAAAYQALLPTIEKLQGAQQVGSHFGLLIQAEKTQAYAGLAIEAGDAMLTQLDALQAALEAEGTYATQVDVGSMIDAIGAGGLTDEDRALVRSFGYDEAQIDAAITSLGALEVDGPLSWQAIVDDARGQFEVMRPALVDLVAQAEAIRNENEPYALRNAPVAGLSAPASATAGATVELTAMGSHIDPEANLSYAWDLDGDGQFDDDTGPAVSWVPPAPGMRAVAVEVSDGMRRDIAMAAIDVAVGNVPPELTTLAPADYSPLADVGEVIALSATATDADGDPVSYAWTVDGADAGTGPTLDFVMPDELPHRVRVVASDDDPYSADAAFTFYVRSSIWEGQVGDTDGGTASGSGGADETAGPGDPDGAGTGGSGAD